MNYTKAEWKAEAVSDDPRSDPRWWVLCDGKIILSTVGGNDEANAKLAAAAPDLFEALQDMLTAFNVSVIPMEAYRKHEREAIEKARAAIAKAKLEE